MVRRKDNTRAFLWAQSLCFPRRVVLYLARSTTFSCVECESPVPLDRGECQCSQDPELQPPPHCEQVTLAALCNQCFYPCCTSVLKEGIHCILQTNQVCLHMGVSRAFSMLSGLQNWSLVLCSWLFLAGPTQASVQFFNHLPNYREILHGPAQ